MCVYINRHIYYFQRVDTISQEFMLMVERYPRLLVQDQADHIHALGWEFLARYWYVFWFHVAMLPRRLHCLILVARPLCCVGFSMFIKYLPTIVLQMEFCSTRSSLNGMSLICKCELEVFGTAFPRNLKPAWYSSLSYFLGGSNQVLIEMITDCKAELVNPRAYHTYLDEDQIGCVKGIAKRCHRKLLELRVLMRYLLRLTHYVRHWASWEKMSWVGRRLMHQLIWIKLYSSNKISRIWPGYFSNISRFWM